MKYILLLFGLAFSFTSCDKNKNFPQYTSLYHIDGNDTISAIHIPNSFTPDGDGINDIFKVVGVNILERDFELCVYRRDGELVYQSDYLPSGWDGTYKGVSAENGNYHCTLKAKDSTGFIFNYEGVLDLVR